MKKASIFIFLFLINIPLNAQWEENRCASDENWNDVLATFPVVKLLQEQLENDY